ncbi:MAG: hypothetical protein M1269_05220 [Chloroflexi bacterium]|nr:hypothetical protein [Chloroflexota bacterium]
MHDGKDSDYNIQSKLDRLEAELEELKSQHEKLEYMVVKLMSVLKDPTGSHVIVKLGKN